MTVKEEQQPLGQDFFYANTSHTLTFMRGLVTSRTSTLEPWMAPLVGGSVRQDVVPCSIFISQHSEQQQQSVTVTTGHVFTWVKQLRHDW